MLEELGVDYDAWVTDIGSGEQFTSGFVEINPNSKIPALYDKARDTRVFESGAILVYLAEQHGSKFLPTDPKRRAECLSWVFWGSGSPPFLGGGFGHFYNYYSTKLEYPINRYAMETKRQLHVLETHLEGKKFLLGDEYTIADMAVAPWYGALVEGKLYSAAEFLNVKEYKNVAAWAARIGARPGVVRGKMVNRVWGPKENQLPERHSKKDFDGVKGAH